MLTRTAFSRCRCSRLLRSLDRQMLPLAERLEKRIKPIEFSGEAVRVPSRPMQHLLLALTHVIHNIVDHGIEAPVTRMAKGKDPQGAVKISGAARGRGRREMDCDHH